jgi:hypothetical protein
VVCGSVHHQLIGFLFAVNAHRACGVWIDLVTPLGDEGGTILGRAIAPPKGWSISVYQNQIRCERLTACVKAIQVVRKSPVTQLLICFGNLTTTRRTNHIHKAVRKGRAGSIQPYNSNRISVKVIVKLKVNASVLLGSNNLQLVKEVPQRRSRSVHQAFAANVHLRNGSQTVRRHRARCNHAT